MTVAGLTAAAMTPLGEVADFIRGITFAPDDKVDPHSQGSVVCMRTANVQADLDQSDLIAIPKEFVRRDEQYLREGDILVSTANSWNLVGKCSWVPKLGYVATAGGFISILRADQRKIDQRYLYHWFSSDAVQHEARLCGRQTTNISNLDFGRCLALTIPLLPLPEQKRIAAILDKADALRRKRQETLKLRGSFIPSLLHDMFGHTTSNEKRWLIKPLSDVVRSGTVVTYGIVQCGPHVEGGVPYIRTSDMTNGDLCIDKMGRTSREIADRFRRSEVRSGDLVYAIRASVGAVHVVPPELDGANLTQGTARIAPGDEVTAQYLLWALRSPGLQQWVARQVKGTTFSEITLERLREMPVPMPPLGAQKEFSAIADRIHAGNRSMSHAVESAGELYNSLVQRAFRGEL